MPEAISKQASRYGHECFFLGEGGRIGSLSFYQSLVWSLQTALYYFSRPNLFSSIKNGSSTRAEIIGNILRGSNIFIFTDHRLTRYVCDTEKKNGLIIGVFIHRLNTVCEVLLYFVYLICDAPHGARCGLVIKAHGSLLVLRACAFML